MRILLLLLVVVPPSLCGEGDTVDQLRVGFTTVPLADQVTNADVTVEEGACPAWLSGTLARHACGVYGETGRPTEDNMVNAVDHVFDCIEMGQAYSFNNGRVSFTSRYQLPVTLGAVKVYCLFYKELIIFEWFHGVLKFILPVSWF